MRKGLKRALIGVAALVVLVPLGTWVFIHFIESKAPARLSLSQSDATSGTSGGSGTSGTSGTSGSSSASGPVTGDVAGTWRPTSASQFGYRVDEVLFGQNHTAAGRTNKVTGTLTIDGTTVRTADLTVDMTSVKSDEDRRDRQFQGRIMDTSSFPNATFKLTQPIQLPSIPTDTSVVKVKATGDLTLRGTTKPVTVDLETQRRGGNLEVHTTIPITFADWNIPNPSFGPISTKDHGELEALVVFERAG